ncbi:hypothetical protein [Microbacterium sp. G2-8]|uniref:hypothetical protein n=1 Tax=Microbacterium sp. G2-8 TaxID=2842454 RepID=UPI001C89FC76|nr:hypothetical protein [Microbacterium sp. G2-8]
MSVMYWRHRWLVIPLIVGMVVLVVLARPVFRAADALAPTSAGGVIAIALATAVLCLPALLLHVSLATLFNARAALHRDEHASMIAGWGAVVGFGLSAATLTSALIEFDDLGEARIGSAVATLLLLLWNGSELVRLTRGSRIPWARVVASGGIILAAGVVAGFLLD